MNNENASLNINNTCKLNGVFSAEIVTNKFGTCWIFSVIIEILHTYLLNFSAIIPFLYFMTSLLGFILSIVDSICHEKNEPYSNQQSRPHYLKSTPSIPPSNGMGWLRAAHKLPHWVAKRPVYTYVNELNGILCSYRSSYRENKLGNCLGQGYSSPERPNEPNDTEHHLLTMDRNGYENVAGSLQWSFDIW